MDESKLEILNRIQQGENVNPFTPFVVQFTHIALTLAGKCDLSEFPDAALLHAAGLLKKRQGIINPYAFLKSQAMSYCRERNLPVDWQWKKALKKAYGLGDTDPCFEADKQATRSPVLSGELPSSTSERGFKSNRDENNYSQKGEIATLVSCRKCTSTRHSTDQHSKLYPLPKRRESSYFSCHEKTAASSPDSAPPPQLTRMITTYGGIKVIRLTDAEAAARRTAFISRPEITQEMEHMCKLMGDKAGKNFFNRVYENLKYMCIDDAHD